MSGRGDGRGGEAKRASRGTAKGTALLVAAALAGALALPTAAFGSQAETWVSGTGKDSGTCTIAAPCASFAYAISQTSSGGEIDVLTSGSFGAVTISEPITISATGVTAAVDFTGSEGIYVDTTGAVVLRGLDVNGLDTGTDAIFDTSGDLEIEDCELYGFTEIGVGLADEVKSRIENTVTVERTTIDGGILGVRTFQSAEPGEVDKVVLDDDYIENATSAGIFDRDSGSQLVAHDDLLEGNDIGFETDTGPGNYTLDNDEIDNNTGAGVLMYAPADGASQLVLDDDQVDDNAGGGVSLAGGSFSLSALLDGDDIDYNTGDGLEVIGTVPVGVSNTSLSGNTEAGVFASGALASVSLTNDTVTQNGTGLESAEGGSIVSLGAGNSVDGNTTNGSPSSTVSDGAVGPTGPAGPSGAAGPSGMNGGVGPTGPAGATGSGGGVGAAGTGGAQGPAGPAGKNGEIELVTCTSVKKKVKRKTITQKKCTTKLSSSPVSFTANAARAMISRGSHVDAVGSLREGKLVLHASKALRAGRYTLRLTTGADGREQVSVEEIAIA
jgi:Right handed beta helix region